MSKAVRYRFTVWATVGFTEQLNGLEPDMLPKEVERQIHRLLAKSDADCDVEYRDQEVIDE